MGFKPGLAWVLERAAAPIVPAHIDGMWGSVLSHSEGRFFSKWPRGWGRGRRRLSVWFGPPLPTGTAPDVARLAIQELSARAVRDRLRATRSAGADLAAWTRRHASAAGSAVRGAVGHLRRGGALDGAGGEVPPGEAGGAIVVDAFGRRFDWADLAATAEAFDGCCLVRRDDRLLSSLAPGDPLYVPLGLLGGPLLGIAAGAVETGGDVDAVLEALAASAATIWIAPAGQVAEAAWRPVPATLPEVVVIPLAGAADLAAAEAASAALAAVWGVEPVVAFAPPAAGALLSMNTPPSRVTAAHEVTCRRGTLGRVVNGTAVWPVGGDREAMGRPPLPSDADVTPGAGDRPADGSLPTVVSAGLSRDGGEEPGWCRLDEHFGIDDEGFLVPLRTDGDNPSAASGSSAARPPRQSRSGRRG